MATGRRQHEPVVITKRIDKSSPLLMKALVENQTIEGVFKFFRPSVVGDGTTEQFYTVQIEQGRISSIDQDVQNVLVPALSTEPPLEIVSFVYHTISWTISEGGITHEDTWNANR